jgi:hypothetical protein
MTTTKITVQVDTDLARIYRSASAEERYKLNLLLNLSLRGLFTQSKTLPELMNALSDKAQARGLTPEELDKILDAD